MINEKASYFKTKKTNKTVMVQIRNKLTHFDLINRIYGRTSGQDGSVGKHGLLLNNHIKITTKL